ncbi:xanthine phosphoribosyltransferase [Carboxydothermus pertinax]|uniref:Xanthine phosphoribosyltransferase n=1 Tax=Carboxydothermus pertinax TaxID=870242 RepID=A0A1L8CRN3_9THEO|nr:xanthine phosphoribosyltransferase [Carboxydothermus pertinax]GAV21524.1 xanthine phosphoribosyltransferase [Carboxydothermus pertinax]
MEKLKEKILTEGRVLPNNVLKVDSFLNHQLDPPFLMEIGQEFAKRFYAKNPNKILTVEASGIALALMTGYIMKIPVVFAKKRRGTIPDNFYHAKIFSYTRQENIFITVDRKYLTPNDRILIIDDFLATGEATRGLIEIVNTAGATLVGVGIAIEKSFQAGASFLSSLGVPTESLVKIKSLDRGKIEFL